MKKCPRCGNEIDEGRNSCPFCGTTYYNFRKIITFVLTFAFLIIIFYGEYIIHDLSHLSWNLAKVQKFSLFRKINPESAQEYYAEGRKKAIDGQSKEAIEDLNKAIENNPNNASYYFMRGYAKQALNEHNSCIEDYTIAIDLNPNYHEAYYNRGWSYDELENYETAIKDFNKAIELNPNRYDYYAARAHANYSLKNYEASASDYNKAIELNPKDNLYEYRGRARVQAKDYENGIKDLKHALEIDPNNERPYSYIGLAYYRMGKYNDAIKILKGKTPSKIDEFDYYYIARSYEAMKNKQEALKYYKKSLEINPNYSYSIKRIKNLN